MTYNTIKGVMENQSDRIILEIKTSRTGEETPEAMVQFLASLTNMRHRFYVLWKKGIPLTLEIAINEQIIHFYISVPRAYQSFIESQLISQYSKAMLSKVPDYLPALLAKKETLSTAWLKTTHSYVYPIRTFSEFKDVDPLSSVLGILAKSQLGDTAIIQILLVPISQSWQKSAASTATAKHTDSSGTTVANPYAAIITQKAASAGFSVSIRVAVNAETKERSAHYLYEVGTSFASFNHPSGNGLVVRKVLPWEKNRFIKEMAERKKSILTNMHVFNVQEIATLFHFPSLKLANIPNISWHKTILSQAPENLPVAESMTEEEKKDVNFFARTEYKNKQAVFGIKRNDRRRHVYVIGKSGTGKSTFIANMAISDIRNGEGLCVIDPHGDLCEHILQYIPSYRVNDVVYMDPADNERSFALNPLEITDESQKELVASGIIAIFKKLYGDSWGPRLEYIFRNTIVSVLEMPNPTLLMVPEMLGNPTFRAKVIERLKDPVLHSFWVNEFEKMTDKLRVEAISPIQNKVGQFTSSTRIRNIIGHPKSSIDIEKVMNEGKILILNLSQGYLGEDNAALLGAMIITKVQLAAMNRVSIPEEQRRDFFLYVDEFQNFATTSFIKILSEARKFRLCLILANQYIAQIPEDVRAAIFGNAGTLMTFLVGADDAQYLGKEYSERFKPEDLLALGNYQAIIKLYIDGITQSPFHCYTLPLPRSKSQNMDKVKRLSKERYTKVMTTLDRATPQRDREEKEERDKEDSVQRGQKPNSPTGEPVRAEQPDSQK
jgi:hypothetical protein